MEEDDDVRFPIVRMERNAKDCVERMAEGINVPSKIVRNRRRKIGYALLMAGNAFVRNQGVNLLIEVEDIVLLTDAI